MERKKLIFLDIDGTLAAPGGRVPPESAQRAIQAARSAGHRCFLCTGRNYGMSRIFLPFGFDGGVCSAGGYVFCGDTVLYDHPMDSETRNGIVRLFEEDGVCYVLEARNDAYLEDGTVRRFLTGPGAASENSELARWRQTLTEDFDTLPLSAYPGEPVYKVVFMCMEERQLDRARSAYESAFSFRLQDFMEQGVLGEMISRAFDKGRGVRHICEHLGVPVEDTVGFGDSMNDLEMIETVGTSVCMGNGSPALKERADYVCPAVDRDGLAEAFKKLGLV